MNYNFGEQRRLGLPFQALWKLLAFDPKELPSICLHQFVLKPFHTGQFHLPETLTHIFNTSFR